METTDTGRDFDHQAWDWFIDYLTGPFMREVIFDDARGPYCMACEGEGDSGKFDEDHEFSPRDTSGQPPCLCGHILQAHNNGEKGPNHPMYRLFEGLVRAKNPIPGYGPTPPLKDYEMIRFFWQLLYKFEEFRASLEHFFGTPG